MVPSPPSAAGSSSGDADPVVLTVAVTGADVFRENNPNIPYTTAEIADSAVAAGVAGATVAHLHVREDDGTPSGRPELFVDVIERIRAGSDLLTMVSTGGANEELSGILVAEAQDREPDALEEQRWALDQCLAKLSPSNRRLLQARYDVSGGALARLSDETGRSNESLRVTLSRIRSSVRRCIRGLLAMEGGIP